jgi:hypothetical protein
MSLEKFLNYLFQVATLVIALHGPITPEPEVPTVVALPLMICPR